MIMPFSIAHLALAGLDARFAWSSVPFAAQLSSLIVMALCFALSIWAMRVNHFFSPVVRIQSERGHRLVTDGPYAYIRHPSYLAAVGLMVSSGIALGSWWSLLPNIGAMLVIFRRLMLEDRFLHENLEGYRDYAQRVRSRLVPAVW
ncbi:MAG: isoprenylcysteine carboxylmethyltransferase family protein [Planctomycetes bacterium]|nr:isoprenylcysteine carboxylmethyltransferase family protein [Planctomycetota bacterium]